jgi:DNA-binding CsgD family transcriptional regulator
MSDTDSFSALIGDIYDAALDPARWPHALEQATKFVGGCAAGLYSKDSVSKSADINHNFTFGAGAGIQKNYMDNYARLDPTTTGLFFFGVGEVIDTADIMPRDEFHETRFYKEWVKPLGWVDAVHTLLDKSTSSYSVISIFRHENDGLADEGCRRRMQLLAPHIRRSVLIGKTIQLKTAQATTFGSVLDGIAAGIFLVDATGRLVHANTRGHAMIAQDSVLRAVAGRLVASQPDADQALRDACSAAASGDQCLDTRGISIPIRDSGQRYVAHVLPLTSGARRRTGAGYEATAAVFVRSAELEAPASPEVIAKLYRLTPSELRVLLALFDTNGVPEIAETLGISEATTKTHLRRLFEKTGAKRQADLVKLVAGFTAPNG